MEVFSGVTEKGRRYVLLSLIGLGSVLLASAGILIALLNATTQYDMTGQILFTSTLGAGVFMTLIAAGLCAWVFGYQWSHPHKAKVKVKEEVKFEPRSAPATSLETALSALIMDFVQDREWKRNQRANAAAAQQRYARDDRREHERRADDIPSEVRH